MAKTKGERERYEGGFCASLLYSMKRTIKKERLRLENPLVNVNNVIHNFGYSGHSLFPSTKYSTGRIRLHSAFSH